MKMIRFGFVSTILMGLTLASFSHNAQASTTDNNLEYRVEELIKEHLRDEGVDFYDAKNALSYEFSSAIQDITQRLTRLTKKASQLVYRSNMDAIISQAISKRLKSYSLKTYNIPSSFTSTFNNKRNNITERLKQSIRSSNYNCVTKQDVSRIVRSELSFSFLQKIKDSLKPTSGFWESLGNAFANILTSENTTSQQTTSQADTTEKADTQLHIFYSDPCVICQANFYGEERVGVLNCGHIFHPECIKQWIATAKTCPCCRAKDVYLAKIYDRKEDVPGYTPAPAPTSTTPTAPEQTYFDGSCPVCIADFLSGERVGRLNCGHTFHPECIKQWLATAKTCPCCRQEDVFLAQIYDTKEDVPQ